MPLDVCCELHTSTDWNRSPSYTQVVQSLPRGSSSCVVAKTYSMFGVLALRPEFLIIIEFMMGLVLLSPHALSDLSPLSKM